VKRVALLLATVAAVAAAAPPATAHVQTKSDADDADSYLDIDETSFWHEDGKFLFLVKTFEKWDTDALSFGDEIEIKMDTKGDGSIDYSIFFRRWSTDAEPTGDGDPKSEVAGKLGNWDIEDYEGKVQMSRPSQRKILFSFNRTRVAPRAKFIRWSARSTQGEGKSVSALGAGQGEPCEGICSDLLPDEEGWFKHEF
jgi:hypothetical protein